MVKLKLTRDKLQVLAACFNPAHTERLLMAAKRNVSIDKMESLFLLLEIGERVTKSYYFNIADKYNIKLKHAEACALFVGIARLELMGWLNGDVELSDHIITVLLEVKGSIHHQLFNYERRFYDTTTQTDAHGRNSLAESPYRRLT